MDVNPVKAKLAQNMPSLGTWSASGDPSVIETLLHTTEFDWVTLDFEHNAIDVSTAVHCLRAGNGSGKPMFARIPSNDPIWVKRVLDIGFTGIVVPDVKNEEEAERAVVAAKYRPRGLRGIGSTRGQLVYGSDYYQKANDIIMVVCMIEDWRAVDRIDKIMEVPDLDVCFVGPNDLASSLGVPTGLDNKHPDHIRSSRNRRRRGQTSRRRYWNPLHRRQRGRSAYSTGHDLVPYSFRCPPLEVRRRYRTCKRNGRSRW